MLLIWGITGVCAKGLFLILFFTHSLVFGICVPLVYFSKKDFFFEEPRAGAVEHSYRVPYLMYVWVIQRIFSTTYQLGGSGTLKKLPRVQLKVLAQISLSLALDVSRLFINFTLALIKVSRHKSFGDYLEVLTFRHGEPLRVSRRDGVWRFNPDLRVFDLLCRRFSILYPSLDKSKIEQMTHLCLYDEAPTNATPPIKIKGLLARFDLKHQNYTGKPTKILHWSSDDDFINKDPLHVLYATDQATANMFITGPGLYYKRIGVFTDVQWESKNTAFLRAQKDEFIQSQGDYNYQYLGPLLKNALLNGYRSEYVSSKFNDTVDYSKERILNSPCLADLTPNQRYQVLDEKFKFMRYQQQGNLTDYFDSLSTPM